LLVHASIHDVTPAWAPEVELAIRMAHAAGAKPALLVVPDYHGAWPLASDVAFCARLRDLQRQGHEVYLHGFFHEAREDGGPPAAVPAGLASARRWAERAFFQQVVSNGEAEFRALPQADGAQLVARGEGDLTALGLRVDGFVAPAWSMPPWLLPLLRARGYRYSEEHLRVHDPVSGASRASVVFNFASRSPARVMSTVAFCRAARPIARVLPARIAIHPADLRLPLLRHEVASLLAWGATQTWAARGRDLLA
jgi:predicted deacetylase